MKVNLQCGIAHVDDETEETSVNILDDGTNTNGDCGHILGLAHPLSANLWQHNGMKNSQKVADIKIKITLYLGLMKQS